MRSVFRCIAGAYRQVGYWDVNAVEPIYGFSCDEELAENRCRNIVGTKVILPDTITEQARFYRFNEGKNHNQLTLTDPKEIYNMRKWVQIHAEEFIEVFCDDEAEHLTEAIFELVEAFNATGEESIAKTTKEPPEAQEELTEWDERYTKLLRNR